MSKRSVVILAALAALLTAFSLALSRRDSSDWRASRARRLFPFPWLAVNSIIIDRPGEEQIAFEKTWAGEWLVVLDGGNMDSLNPQAVEELSALVMLPWRETVPGLSAPEPDGAVSVTAAAGGETVRIAFGETRQNLRAAIVDGHAAAVYGVNQDFAKVLDWPRERFRNLNLLAAPAGKRPVRITIAPGPEVRTVLERRDAGWAMAEPVEWPVEAARLDTLLRWMENLRADSIAAETTGDAEWFGFTADSVFVEAVFADDEGVQTVRRVEIGRESVENDSESYARAIGRNPVFTVSRMTLDEISLELGRLHPGDWANFYRQRTLNLLGSEMPRRIVVERLLPTPAKLSMEMYYELDEVRWRGTLEKDGVVQSFPVDPPAAEDPSRPLNALIAGLSRLRIKYFLADQNPGPETARWTAHPAWKFTTWSAGGAQNPTLTLYAADAEGNLPPGSPYAEGTPGPVELRPLQGMPEFVGVAASTGDRAAVLELYSDSLYLLCQPLYRFHTRHVVDSDTAGWASVAIESADGVRTYVREPRGVSEQWWLEDGTPLMDDNNRFVITAMGLSQLHALAFAAEDASGDKFGLDRPVITAIVYGAPGGGGAARGG
ncbi:MAG: DUF4340 domain-containing protein [Planctomycetota bacterium]|jgi:hypothetical protein|nr:DUF4340 domain-containing protein [Planctomycetota bacterium]